MSALSKAKSKAVEEENYIEAEKLKQIILKIEKLKVYVNKLESQKADFATHEKYDDALKIKNEVDRIKKVVLSITSGTNQKPKVMPPIYNAHTSVERHNQNLSKSFLENSGSIRTKQSYENFRASISKKENPYNPYSFNETEEPEEKTVNTKQMNFAGLKASNYYKRSGILKMNNGGNNLNDMSMLSNPELASGVNSTVNLSFIDDGAEIDETNYRSNRKHVRIMDPKKQAFDQNQSKSPGRDLARTPSTPFIQKNADHRIVPGALRKQPIDFSKVVEAELKNEQSGDTEEHTYVDDIDPSEVHRAEPYFEFFNKETVKKVFSRKWNLREEGYIQLANEFVNLTGEAMGDTQGESGSHMISFKSKKQE